MFGAGRERRIYALPPYTQVVSLDFEDHPFERTRFEEPCALCGAAGVYLDEVVTDDAGGRMLVCSDTDHCEQRRAEEVRARLERVVAGFHRAEADLIVDNSGAPERAAGVIVRRLLQIRS